MLTFILPVKHPARSHSYRIVTDLLRRTLESVQGQTDPNFSVIVVCNRAPDWAGSVSGVDFVEVDFPPAEPPARREDWVEWLYEDKGAKIAVGLQHAKRFNPTHVMFVDADDFVSRHLAAFVRKHPDATGWYMQEGLIYSGVFRIAESRDRFWSYCGTSHIFRADLVPTPDSLGLQPSKEAVLAALDSFFLRRILGCHVDPTAHFQQRGQPLEALPFVGAVWHADTGENSSRAWWNGTRFGPIWGTPLTAEQSTDFGIPRVTRGVPQTMLLYGWRARALLARSVKRAIGRK